MNARRLPTVQAIDRWFAPGTAKPVFALPQHAYEHGSEHLVLRAVDQTLGEGAGLRIGPELADPVRSLELGQREDVEEFCAGCGTKSQAFAQSALKLIGAHS